MSNEDEQGAAIEQMRQRIVERFGFQDRYQNIDIDSVLMSFNMADNPANRSVIQAALKAADDEAAKYSEGPVNISDPREAAAYLKSMGTIRRKR